MDSLWLLLYSKFSPACGELIDIINSNNLKISLETLCIDNKDVRKRILSSKKFNIEHVPCILHIIKSTGVVEQYEGEKSFNLVETLIIPEVVVQQPSFLESMPLPPSIPEQSLQSLPQSLPQQPPNLTTMIDDLDDMEQPAAPIVNVPSALKQKVSPGDIMALAKGREDEPGIKTNIGANMPPPSQQQPSIEQKKTGKPVDIAAAMSAARGRE